MSTTSLTSSSASESIEYSYVNKEAIDADLICSICRKSLLCRFIINSVKEEPFIQPMSVPECEHIFCKECISKVTGNKCPTCRTIFSQAQVKPAHRFIAKQLEAIQVRCTNKGCNWTGSREQHGVHIKECTFETVPCPFSKFGCSFSGTRGAAEKHTDTDCKFKEFKLFFLSYFELEKKVQVLEKKVESLQKGGSSASSSSGPQIIPFLPSTLVRTTRSTPEEEEQLRQLHAAAMRATNERAKKEQEEKEKKQKEQQDKPTANP